MQDKSHILDHIKSTYDDQLYSDFTIVSSNSYEKIRVNRLILNSNKYFKYDVNIGHDMCRVSNIASARALIKYIYGFELDLSGIKSIDDLIDTINLASKWKMIESISCEILSYLETNLENIVAGIADISRIYSCIKDHPHIDVTGLFRKKLKKIVIKNLIEIAKKLHPSDLPIWKLFEDTRVEIDDVIPYVI